MELRRRKLIETARKLFIERGFHATGVAQIARESGIAVAQMYRDFASKEDVVAALAEEDCAGFLRADALKSAICSGDPDQTMTWLLGLLESDVDREGRRLFAEIIAESARNERIASIFTSLQFELRSTVIAALAQLAPDPGLEEQRSLIADLILTFSLGLLHHQLMAPDLRVEGVIQAMQAFIKERVNALTAA
ncbi:MAG TPA: helix-turn-helix domain-containing protein [Rhizorhapis sp.]|nr:helix-turn-helix domain-containing protein [Rhizorhapis sp.]